MKSAFIALVTGALVLSAPAASAQTAREVLGPAGFVPLTEPQPPAKIIVDPPPAGPLANGRVFIRRAA